MGEHDERARVERILVVAVRKAIGAIPITGTDRETIRRVREQAAADEAERSFFELMELVGAEMSPGFWSWVLLLGTADWDDATRAFAATLPELRAAYPSRGDAPAEELLDAAIVTLALIGGSGRTDEIASAAYRLARAAEGCGETDAASDLAAAAMDFGPAHPQSEPLARHALALALAAGHLEQVAAASGRLAMVLAAAAERDASRRLEAFDACEAALERMAAMPEPLREHLAERLAYTLSSRDWLQPLRTPLVPWLPHDRRPRGVAAVPGSDAWSARVLRQPLDEWAAQLRAQQGERAWEARLEAARAALESPPPEEGARGGDWSAWLLDHPAYRRAVPVGTSALRDPRFDEELLVLSHELTRVLAMTGGLGTALTALRVAALDAETRLWAIALGTAAPTRHALQAHMAAEGVAPLSGGDVMALFRAEQALELTRKAHLLQDLWTPWVEGLAVFAECAADPALDPAGASPVTECLRNLVDVGANDAADGAAPRDPAALARAFDALGAELEARCSAAIARRGPARLLRWLRDPGTPYDAGYVAVRAVVAAWRRATGRPLTATDAFGLLLHATRWATHDAIPDLSLPSDRFAAEAAARMRDWAARLAALPREDIEEFLVPPEHDAPARSYRWEELRLVPATLDATTQEARDMAALDARLREAMLSLARPGDEARLPAEPRDARRALAIIARTLRDGVDGPLLQWRDVARHLATVDGFLPVANGCPRFHLDVDPTTQEGMLAVSVRTTTPAAGSGPEMDTLWIPVGTQAAETIAGEHARSARPRMEVVRLIDLRGVAVPDPPLAGLHLLAVRYGAWFDVRGTTPEVDALLDGTPERRTLLRRLVRARLAPSALVREELEVIVPGRRGAERTRDWIATVAAWSAEGLPVAAGEWARRVHALAEEVLDDRARQALQREAARLLLEATTGDEAIARALGTRGFEAGTAELFEERDTFANALFATAQRPLDDRATTYAASLLLTLDLPLLVQTPHGWDVRPAEPATAVR